MSHGERTHDRLCVLDEPCDEENPEHGYCGFSAPLYCIHCHRWCICERLEKARADEREQAAQRVREAQHEDWCVFHGTNPDANECDCFHAACIAAARGEEQ